MNELPRQKLCELIAKYGESLCDEPGRCEALLRDSCGQYRKEINALIDALKERIASELLSSSVSIPIELLIARLSKRLQDNRNVTEEAARWSVESWALALGKISSAQLTKPKEASATNTV